MAIAPVPYQISRSTLIGLILSPFFATAGDTKIQCDPCRLTLNAHYLFSGESASEDLERTTACVRANAKQHGTTELEARMYLELTGHLNHESPAKDPKVADRERDRLLAETSRATGQRWPFAGGCHNAALALERHLKSTLSDEFNFEVVNRIVNIDPEALVDFNAISLVANHYVVRAQSLATKKVYIVDGYFGPSADLQDDLVHRRRYFFFNEYGSCLLNEVYLACLGVSFGDSLKGLFYSLAPVGKTYLANLADQVYQGCLSGQREMGIYCDGGKTKLKSPH